MSAKQEAKRRWSRFNEETDKVESMKRKEGGRKEVVGGGDEGVRVGVSVLCPWQRWTHTEEADWRRATPSTSTLYPEVERRRREGDEERAGDNAKDETNVRRLCVSDGIS